MEVLVRMKRKKMGVGKEQESERRGVITGNGS